VSQETRLSAQLATNHSNLTNYLTAAFDQLESNVRSIQSSLQDRIDLIEHKVSDELTSHRDRLTNLIDSTAAEEREMTRADLTVGKAYSRLSTGLQESC